MLFLLFAVVFIPMLFEVRRAVRNEAALRAAGGLEPSGDVYKMMRFAYPGAFAAMLAEGAWRGLPNASTMAAGATVFALAKALKWWAILTLGRFWSFRVIVLPGAPLVVTGPYRWLRHPNYVGVVGEFLGAALMTGAAVAGCLTAVVWTELLMKRVAVETGAVDRRLN